MAIRLSRKTLYALGVPLLLILLVSVYCQRLGGWRAAWALLTRPVLEGDLVFAVIGDSGTGNKQERAVAEQMSRLYAKSHFQLVLMLGDNVYPHRCGERAFQTCFEEPFRPLLDAGVRFYATLGNHDEATSDLSYRPFNMEGRRYYTFTAGSDLAQFFSLDSEQMDAAQLAWIETALAASHAAWKIVFFHRPIYNVGRQHGPNLQLRQAIEPLLAQHGVSVVLSGHEHLYERLVPQKGVVYFVSGSAGHVNRRINYSDASLAAGDDVSCTFMVFALTPRELRYRVITSNGKIVDDGSIAPFESAR